MKLAFSLALIFAGALNANAQTLVQDSLYTNAQVRTIVKKGNIVYLGGDFTKFGAGVPYAAPVNKTSKEVFAYQAYPNAAVRAIIDDGSGGWFIGGDFTQVGGQPRNHLAKINADGSLNPWNPDCNGPVNTIALLNNTIFVGGSFSNVGGQARANIACINADGTINPWVADANGEVQCIVPNVTEIYVGGNFTSIASQSKAYIACVNATTGIPTAFDALLDGPVYTIFYKGATIVIGGKFSNAGGWAVGNAVELNASVGYSTPWRPQVNDTVYKIVVDASNNVYLGGAFTQIGTTVAKRMAQMNLSNLTVAPTDVNGTVRALFLDGNTLYVGGYFTNYGGVQTKYFATVVLGTGVFPWNGSLDGPVNAIHVTANNFYVGGQFTKTGPFSRNRIAAFDASNLQVLPFHPNIGPGTIAPDCWVSALAIAGDTLFAAGRFTNVGPVSRGYLAAINATTGADLGWNFATFAFTVPPVCDAVTVDGNTLYVGGEFEIISNTSRAHIAAFDLPTLAIKPFNAAIPSTAPFSTTVNQILIHNGNAYLSGSFITVGGQPRNHFAVVDKISGAVQALNVDQGPGFGPGPKAAIVNNTLYVGGNFTNMSGQPRNRLAAFDLTTQTLLPFNPGADNRISSLLANGNELYLGGSFTNIAGVNRTRLARLDLPSGQAATWDGNVNGPIGTMVLDNNRLYVGGSFSSILGQTKTNFAILENPVGAPLPVQILSFTARPNQVGGAWKVNLEWSTSFEQNSSHFVVERSSDGRRYSELATLTAAGNSNTVTNYNFADQSPVIGTAYYRLKQIDLDGRPGYSKIAIAIINGKEIVALVYPNPSSDFLNLLVSSPVKQQAHYNITDISGRVVKEGNFSLQKGDNNFVLPVTGLSEGTYNLQISGMNSRQMIRFVRKS